MPGCDNFNYRTTKSTTREGLDLTTLQELWRLEEEAAVLAGLDDSFATTRSAVAVHGRSILREIDRLGHRLVLIDRTEAMSSGQI
jgi:hypothetical protein